VSSAFDLSTLFGSPEALVAQHADRLARLADLQREVAEATGEAASADGRVHVRYSETRGIGELKLDPRVLRLPADDLADLITRTVNEAKQASAAVVAEATNRAQLAGIPDPEAVLDQVPGIQQFLADVTTDTGRMTEHLESLVERMSARATPTGSANPRAQWSAR
jgi:DNA-binding protein YbaB